MALIALFGAMLLLMLLRVALPFGARIEGKPIGKVTLSFRERVRLQRTNVYAIGSVLLLGALTGDMPPAVEPFVIVGVVAILCIPVRYVFTDAGVALNRTVFRPWSDFTHFQTAPGRITLVPRPGLRLFHVVLAPARCQQVVPTVRRLLPERAPRPSRRFKRFEEAIIR
jgi:hypothetical protein